MAIDCYEGQGLVNTKASKYPPLKPFQSPGTLKIKMGEPGIPGALLDDTNSHWEKLINKGTATEKKESSAIEISIIAQPECENNPQICPTLQEGPVYIPDSKQYSLAENNEHIPNNVVNATECKPAQAKYFSKSKRKRRKKRSKEDNQTPAKRGQTTPEQETGTPVPVQVEECQSEPWTSNDILDFCSKSHHNVENIIFSPQNAEPNDGNKNALHKLISPTQFFYHIGAVKQQPPSSPQVSPYTNDRLPEIISALGLDDWENNTSKHWDYSKLTDSCPDSKSHSVEEGVLFALRGSVSSGETDKLCLMAKAWENDDGEPVDNEGILFKKEMMPQDYEYRQDVQWDKSEEILGSGSFGDVYSGTDKISGFQFAVKKLHVDKFRSQEVTCCLSISSDKILPLYGAVREGPWITLFMKKMNGGSLGQLIKKSGYLTEDQALYYMSQALQGLQHLHTARVIHGDVKADNILLTEDGKTACLCDFGHAAQLPPGSSGTNLLTGDYVPGTETHMAPEIVRGEPCGTKLDVWSACCMLLHMLNGWHPWSRTHTAPLCLKIATEPPPLQEIPPNCNPTIRELIVAGLQKDPNKRSTAAELNHKVDEALTEKGGLKSPHSLEYREPRNFPPTKNEETESTQSIPQVFPQDPEPLLDQQIKHIIQDPAFTTSARSAEQTRTSCEMEIERLQLDLYMENLSQPFSVEEHPQIFLSEDSLDPLKSGKDSMNTLDTGSSGFVSLDSHMESWSLQNETLFSGGNTSTPSWFTGLKVKLKTFNGEIMNIWESGRTKVGDLALGISSQIPIKSFTIVNSKGNPIPLKTDIADCGIELQCSLAPDGGEAWLWRVKKGVIEEINPEVSNAGGRGVLPSILTPE
ncbi:mitogen-activated protein kinase kinase kinase 14 [Hyperolius riggenbachi]|uniref:mitogen-activated protein kinase kinase kinase 14 n=1 Tax=Hyperolius riggenbachi TaxID=752182 RepID=UPI0035A3B160